MNPSRPEKPRATEIGRKLASWKAIAEYFDCDERTAKRWEHERGLPVHRAPGGKRSGVYAYATELDSWLRLGQQDEVRHPAHVADAAGVHRAEALSLGVQPPLANWDEPILKSSQGLSPSNTASLRPLLWLAACVATLILAEGALLIRNQFRTNAPASGGVRGSSSSVLHLPAPGAEALYLRGRYYWNLRTADSLSKAIDAYMQALEKDPSYAEAYAGLAESYDLLPQFAHADLGGAFERAEAAADKAIQLDPNLAAAHRAKAFALFFWDWDIPGSDAEFRRALALDPNSAETHHWYASTLLNRLEGPECMRQIDEALRLNPTSAAISTDAALIHADFGNDLDGSVQRLKEIEQTQPALLTPSYFLNGIDFARGDYPAYIAELRHLAAMTHNPDDLALADSATRGWARGGKAGMLEELIRVQKQAFERGTETGFILGQYYVLLGRPKEALPYFRAALDKHFILVMTMQDCDWARPLATDPDYAALFTQIRQREHGGNTAHPRVVPISFRLPQ